MDLCQEWSSSRTHEARDSVLNHREDIVSDILSHLTSNDLTTCMRVSRLWYDEASRILYRHVKLDQATMPSFLYGISSLCDDVEPCRAVMVEGIWKDCDHETSERLEIASQPRMYYNFKAPLLRFVQTLTIGSHHRCICAPAGPFIHRFLVNLKLVRVVRSICGCPNSCAINPFCDSASCSFLNCTADKYVFRNNDGDCAAAALSRLDRQGYPFGAWGRENKTTIVLPRMLGLLHRHGPADIAFRFALERATSLKIVFADWEGSHDRPIAMTITFKDAKVLVTTLADLLRAAPVCREIVVCGLERVELAATRGGQANVIDADDLRILKKDIENHIRKVVWIKPSLPDFAQDSHPGDFVLALGSQPPPHHGDGPTDQVANGGTSNSEPDFGDALPGANVHDLSTIFGSEIDEGEATEDESASEDDSSSDGDGDVEAGEGGESGDAGSGIEGNEDSGGGAPNANNADHTDGELAAASQELLTALAAGWNIVALPVLPAAGPATQAGAAADQHPSVTSASAAQEDVAPTAANDFVPPAAVFGPGPTHGTLVDGQSLFAMFQELVVSLTHAKPVDGKIVFQTFDEYLADKDSRGELSL